MSRACGITDEQLAGFARGEQHEIEEHVAGCNECQAFLAEVWQGALTTDLAEPVVQAIRIELFLLDAAKLGLGILARMARAVIAYGTGGTL